MPRIEIVSLCTHAVPCAASKRFKSTTVRRRAQHGFSRPPTHGGRAQRHQVPVPAVVDGRVTGLPVPAQRRRVCSTWPLQRRRQPTQQRHQHAQAQHHPELTSMRRSLPLAVAVAAAVPAALALALALTVAAALAYTWICLGQAAAPTPLR